MNTIENSQKKDLFKHLPVFDLNVKPYEVILTRIPTRENQISGKIQVSKKDLEDLQKDVKETVPFLVNKVGNEVNRYERGDIVYISGSEIVSLKINTKDEFWKIAAFANMESIICSITKDSELYNIWLNHFDSAIDKIVELTKEEDITPKLNRLVSINDNNSGIRDKERKVYSTGK